MKTLLRFSIIIGIIAVLLWWGSCAEASEGFSEERLKLCTLRDGVTIAVHYYYDELAGHHAAPDEYADTMLKYAAEAYNEIVYVHGFDTPGFTFANPDKDYCYDADRNIDVYVTGDSPDMPYYDISKGEDGDYDALILFPANYTEDPVKIRGACFHEMLHLITYSYNKNIEEWYRRRQGSSCYEGGDWYVEGLARYFETIAGSYDNFFSEGFVKRNSDRLTIYQGGVNFFMDHPSQSLKEARYDYALFWAYIHKTYGMERIEEISRRFRFISRDNMKYQVPGIISSVLGEDFDKVLKGFAIAMYFKNFNPDIKKGLNDIKTMSLDDFLDGTEKRIASWSSNFITLDLNKKDTPGSISLNSFGGDSALQMTVIANLEDNKIVQLRDIVLDRSEVVCNVDLSDMKCKGVEKLILIITNTHPDQNAGYRLLRN